MHRALARECVAAVQEAVVVQHEQLAGLGPEQGGSFLCGAEFAVAVRAPRGTVLFGVLASAGGLAVLVGSTVLGALLDAAVAPPVSAWLMLAAVPHVSEAVISALARALEVVGHVVDSVHSADCAGATVVP